MASQQMKGILYILRDHCTHLWVHTHTLHQNKDVVLDWLHGCHRTRQLSVYDIWQLSNQTVNTDLILDYVIHQFCVKQSVGFGLFVKNMGDKVL